MEYRGHGGRGNGLRTPQRGGQQDAREADGEGAQVEPAVAPQEVEDVAARVGAESHPDGGDEEDPAVGGSHDPLAEGLAGGGGGEGHDAAIGRPEDPREAGETARAGPPVRTRPWGRDPAGLGGTAATASPWATAPTSCGLLRIKRAAGMTTSHARSPTPTTPVRQPPPPLRNRGNGA